VCGKVTSRLGGCVRASALIGRLTSRVEARGLLLRRTGVAVGIFGCFRFWIPFPELNTDLSVMYQDLGSLMFYIDSEYVG